MLNKLTPEVFQHKLLRESLENGFIENKWVKIYCRETSHPIEDVDIEHDIWQWVYLVSPNLTEKVLTSYNADLCYDEYSTLLNRNSFLHNAKDGFESIITVMNFDSIIPRRTQIRINEDLIYMFHLYESIDNNGNRNFIQYIDGEDKVVITISKNEVKILHQYLYDFLASKKMNLVCAIRSEINMPPSLSSYIGYQYTYTGHAGISDSTQDYISNYSVAITGGIELRSWFIGKKVIHYKEFGEFKSSFDGDYAEFTIGYDTTTCKNIRVRCDDDSYKYKRVFFKKGVLDKYRQDVNVKISANAISSLFFSLKCDNERPDYIWAFLKDLRNLPYSEQLHWASNDILPLDTPPSEFYEQSQINWNASSSSPDFIFRDLYVEVNRLWQQKFGWRLFKTTTGLQNNAIERVFVLGTNEPGYFRSLLLPFNLILSESLNVSELDKLDFSRSKKNVKGIKLLGYYLDSQGYSMTCFINFLLQLNTLRSMFSDAHRNKSEYNEDMIKALDYIGLDTDNPNYVEASVNLFNKANDALRWLMSIIDTLKN